jgi:hypothetical protein
VVGYGAFVLREPFSKTEFVGYLVTLFGFIAYSYFKATQIKTEIIKKEVNVMMTTASSEKIEKVEEEEEEEEEEVICNSSARLLSEENHNNLNKNINTAAATSSLTSNHQPKAITASKIPLLYNMIEEEEEEEEVHVEMAGVGVFC